MSGHHIGFVALDLALQHHRGAAVDDPPTEPPDHRPGVILVDVELPGDLRARQVQPHEIQAGDPGPQRQVMAGEDGVGEVVEALTTAPALIHDPNAIATRAALTMPPEHPAHPTHRPEGPASTLPPSRPSVERDGGSPLPRLPGWSGRRSLLGDVGGGHHRLVTFDARLILDPSEGSPLASVQLAVDIGVHSKASWRRMDEGCEVPRLFARTRRFSSFPAPISLELRLVEDEVIVRSRAPEVTTR
jgi:hypothetical protein